MSNAANQMKKITQIDINDDAVMPGDGGIAVGETFTNKYDTSRTVGDVAGAYVNMEFTFHDSTETTF